MILRRLAVLGVLLWLLVSAGSASAQTMACSASNFSAVAIDTSTATASKSVVMPNDVPSGATIIVGLLDRTDETTTFSNGGDPVNGASSYTASTPVDSAGSTFRTWLVYKVNSAALTGAGNRTVTVVTSAGISTQLIAGFCTDSAAQTFDTSSSALHNDAANDTNHDTGTLATSAAGGIIGVAGDNNAITSYTMDGAGESQLSAVAAGQRLAIFFEGTTASGSYGFEVTSNPTLANSFVIAGFLSPAGGSTRAKDCALMGAC